MLDFTVGRDLNNRGRDYEIRNKMNEANRKLRIHSGGQVPPPAHYNMPHKAIIIVGQTATGKTNLSIDLAERYGGEIISCDSRQVYTGLNIGSAKITEKEMQGIPHHMIDVWDPRDHPFTAHDYVRMGRDTLHAIWGRGKLPIIVGGTGLYADLLTGRQNLDATHADPEHKKTLEKMEKKELQELLQGESPEIFKNLNESDRENPVRLISHILRSTQKTLENNLEENSIRELPDDFKTLWIGIERDPEELRQRIALRNTMRLSGGDTSPLVQEVKELHASGLSWKRMESLGLEYRYVGRYVRGEITNINELLEILNQKTWQYAKRQKTWFKRNDEIKWFLF